VVTVVLPGEKPLDTMVLRSRTRLTLSRT